MRSFVTRGQLPVNVLARVCILLGPNKVIQSLKSFYLPVDVLGLVPLSRPKLSFVRWTWDLMAENDSLERRPVPPTYVAGVERS